MQPGIFEGVASAVTPSQPSATVASAGRRTGLAAIGIRSKILEQQVRDNAAKSEMQRKDFNRIEQDILRTETEQKEREARVAALDAKLEARPPEMPTQTRLTLGEGIGAALGVLSGNAYEGVTAAQQVAEKRQTRQFENDLRAFTMDRENAMRQVDREESVSNYLRQKQGNLEMARTDVLGRIEDVNSERGWQMDLENWRQSNERMNEIRRTGLQKEMMQFEQGLNMKLEDRRKQDQMSAVRIEAVLKMVGASIDEAAVHSALLGLKETEGFEVDEGFIALMKRNAGYNKAQWEFEKTYKEEEQRWQQWVQGQQLGFQGRAQDNDDAESLARLRGELGNKGTGTKITAADVAGGAQVPATPGMAGNAPMGVNVGGGIRFEDAINALPEMSDAAKAQYGDFQKAFQSFETVRSEYLAHERNQPSKGENANVVPKAWREWDKKRQELKMKADQAFAAKEEAMGNFKALKPQIWDGWVKGLRETAKAQIKETDKAGGDAIRRLFRMKTGEDL